MLTHAGLDVTIFSMPSESLKTVEDVRAWLDLHGVTISDWARAHGFKPSVACALLSGRTRGRWGAAYRAAVVLGLRSSPQPGDASPLQRQGPSSPRDESEARWEDSKQEALMT